MSNDLDPGLFRGRAWAEVHGFQAPVTFAPPRECRADDPHPAIEFTSLSEGQTILVSPVARVKTFSMPPWA